MGSTKSTLSPKSRSNVYQARNDAWSVKQCDKSLKNPNAPASADLQQRQRPRSRVQAALADRQQAVGSRAALADAPGVAEKQNQLRSSADSGDIATAPMSSGSITKLPMSMRQFHTLGHELPGMPASPLTAPPPLIISPCPSVDQQPPSRKTSSGVEGPSTQRLEVKHEKCDHEEVRSIESAGRQDLETSTTYIAISMSHTQMRVEKKNRSRGAAEVRSFVMWSFSNQSEKPSIFSNLDVEVFEPPAPLRSAWQTELESSEAKGTVLVWHATTPAGIEGIIAHGFDAGLRDAQNNGKCEGTGNQFSLDPHAASRYSWKRRGKKGPASVLLVELILGKHVREAGATFVSTSSLVVLPRAVVTVTFSKQTVKFDEKVVAFSPVKFDES